MTKHTYLFLLDGENQNVKYFLTFILKCLEGGPVQDVAYKPAKAKAAFTVADEFQSECLNQSGTLLHSLEP